MTDVAIAKALPTSELIVARAWLLLCRSMSTCVIVRATVLSSWVQRTWSLCITSRRLLWCALRSVMLVVMAEVHLAQWAITEKGVPLMQAMLADVRSRGLALEGVTAEDVLAARNTIGIDIGEGTINFPVFTNGKFNADASVTFGEGYGTVLTRALESMDAEGFHTGFTSRKQLADFLQREPRR